MSGNTLNERVAEEIRVMIARRNISAAELARRTGITQRSISRITTGEKGIDMDDLEKIAAALGVEIAALLPATTGTRGINQIQSAAVARATPVSVGRATHPHVVHAAAHPSGPARYQPAGHAPGGSPHGRRRPAIQPHTHGGVTP